MDALAKLLQENIIKKYKEGYFNQYDDSIILAVPINKEQYEFKKDGTFLGIKPIYEDRNLNDKNCQASLDYFFYGIKEGGEELEEQPYKN